MDRPKQIARSLRRTLGHVDRATLDALLVVWQGPPLQDLALNTDLLLQMAASADADTVIVDSLKDAALRLSDDNVGAGYNRARQNCLAAGVEVIELHHNVKRGNGGAKPNTIADVYGSTWITAGAGSVLMLWGDPGDPIVELIHLKQPADPFGPCKVIHDHTTGTSQVWNPTDLIAVITAKGADGLTAKAAAAVLYDTETPDRNHIEKARRKLNKLARGGQIAECPGDDRTATPTTWRTLTQTLTHPKTPDALTEPSRPSRDNVFPQVSDPHADPHDPHAALPSRTPPPFNRGGVRGAVDQDQKTTPHLCECGGVAEPGSAYCWRCAA
jgi:replicative DNA helicase